MKSLRAIDIVNLLVHRVQSIDMLIDHRRSEHAVLALHGGDALQHFACAVGFERDDQLAGIGHRMDFRAVPGGKSQYAADADVRRLCRKMGMVFQSFNLFPHMTVLQNVIEAPVTVKGLRRDAVIPKAEELLRKVGLLAKRDNYPGRLSGGQKQRVAIARALAMEPDIMLFDEPTSALDPELTGEVLRTMRQLADEHMTMLVVTHEMGFARKAAHRVVFMDEGRILEEAASDRFFDAPQHPRTREFLAHML
ncbi:amino acid ABC transporter ATP-binding protein [Bordetella parapertussis]|nr:amino acid ABC transporter ATP-binding protein [Bordetella parapertussis]QJP66157.1 amino acid ABC transporter ATP-binding protein [Bordetella parapertussis]